ncbi:MAG: hypothetical protein IJW03_02365 [Clostridia bacterium]|nr:hypothetical protein [Clostridia bacterium]
MKKIALIILTLIFSLSLFMVFTSCDKKDETNDDTTPPSSDSTTDDDGNKDEPDDPDDPVVVPSASSKLIGIVGVLDAYDPDDDKSYITVDVPQHTDTIVYLISREAISGITAKFHNITNDADIKVELSEWTYDETRGIYYATFKAPNAAGNAAYQLFTQIDGKDTERVFVVQVRKKMNVDPNGWV